MLATRVGMQRAGARLQVSKDDIAKALAGERTRATECVALTLREISEEERSAWVANGLITESDLRRVQAFDPRTRRPDPPGA